MSTRHPCPATTLGNMVKTFLQKILDITDFTIAGASQAANRWYR